MRHFFALLVLSSILLLTSACGFSSGSLHAVSIPAFNAHAGDYVDTSVIIVGFLSSSGGHVVLYLTEEHAIASDKGNALYLADLSPSEIPCLKSWVQIVGEVDYLPGLLFPGIVRTERISRVHPQDPESRECFSKMDAA